jgi:hypothetical protein
MIGRRAVLGLSLLSALMFCALAAQGASAAEAKNTTAVTCIEVANGFFEDAHCDVKLPSATGHFEHAELTGTIEGKTDIHVTNEKTAEKTTKSTPVTTKFVFGGVEVHIICKKVVTDPSTPTSWIANTGTGSEHKVEGTIAINIEECEVVKPVNCKVKEPKTLHAKFKGVEELGASKNEMGLEFVPNEGTIFNAITFEGEKCVLKGKTINVEGTAIGTSGSGSQTAKHHGATVVFTAAMTKETLKVGGKAAEFVATFTLSMVNKEGITEWPIAFTTTT